MNESTQSERLEMRWMPVIDASGRTHMEASWVVVPTGSTQQQSVTHAA